jgi:protein O-mannosyl-transferase
MTAPRPFQLSAFSFRPSPRLVCVLLAALVVAVYWPALHCEFINVDDGDYVTLNPNIQHGLNGESIRWAFTTGHAANWHPVTWFSHMLDYQLYGLRPLGHHLTSLLLHAANAVLLFLLLHRMTGALWPAAWVAAIFALHPLRVESVVWVAERKDVLSTFFWMFAVGAYIRYAGLVGTPRCGVRSAQRADPTFKFFYALSVFFFALGLMSKSMLVTLPFVLLLLDYWPLGRLEFGQKFSRRLIAEKIPFLALAACASVITFLTQDHFGAVTSQAIIPLGQRLANIPVAYVRYLAMIFWPSGLGPFYGHEHWSFLQVAGAIFLLGAITAWVVWQGRVRPYLPVGWFWFLGMILPTIGLVQVGRQSLADRYSYLPSVGIFLMAAWGARDVAARRPWLLPTVATAGTLALAACAVLTPRQISFWKTPMAFLARAAEISDQDCQTCYNVGCEAMEQRNFARAARCFERALKAADKNDPLSLLARVQNNLGCTLLEQGHITNAVDHFEKALELQPRYPQAYYNMGRVFLTNGQPNVAVDCFQHALALDQNPVVLGALATAYAQAGNMAEAVSATQKARQLALAQNNPALAKSLESQLRRFEAGAGASPP